MNLNSVGEKHASSLQGTMLTDIHTFIHTYSQFSIVNLHTVHNGNLENLVETHTDTVRTRQIPHRQYTKLQREPGTLEL